MEANLVALGYYGRDVNRLNLKWPAGFLVAIMGLAQTSAFEVASIKLSMPGTRGFRTILPGGTVRISHQTLREMVNWAWDIQTFRISGGPKWLDSEHYDIFAKPENPTAPGAIPPMLQALLANRFQLKVHKETRELPIYELVMARKDRKFGPSLTESKEGGCRQSGPPNLAEMSRPPSPAALGNLPVLGCGESVFTRTVMKGVAVGIDAMSRNLSYSLGRAVIDKTGLTGTYDIYVAWTPSDPNAPNASDSGPSIFTALEEQLGLKLESTKGLEEVLIIDSAEKPSEN